MSAPEVHGPAQLPDLRLWLADQWAPGRPFHRAAAPYHAARADRLHSEPGHLARQADNYARHERQTLQSAGLWWVAEPMVDLLLAAAAGVPDDTMLGDLPKMPGTGFVVFAKPWLGIDGYDPDNRVQVDALMWGMVSLPQREGSGRRLAMSISTYRCMDFGLGLSGNELGLAVQVGAIDHATHHPVPPPLAGTAEALAQRGPGARVGSIGTGPTDKVAGTVATDGSYQAILTGNTWVPLGRSDWPLEDAIGLPTWPNEPEQTIASMTEDRKVVAAMWHLLHQEGIAEQSTHAPERQAARRTQRAGIPRKLADVQVVTLRKLHRTESPAGDEPHAHRDWTHRWLVAGHWRWARVGPGRSQRRLTYVRPHVKGPDDKPLRVPTRVNAWQR